MKINAWFKTLFCKHESFDVCQDQRLPHGYLITIDKQCTQCGARYIFRRESECSPWYRWSKAH